MNNKIKQDKYHNPESCNKCGGVAEYVGKVYDGGLMSECSTKCTECGCKEYWAYGFFESGSEMESNCKQYSYE